MTRLLPGTVGKAESLKAESFEAGLLDYPHYTRPAEFRGMKVPEVLLSGNHAEIKRWQDQQQLQRTRDRRPDLLAKLGLDLESDLENTGSNSEDK